MPAVEPQFFDIFGVATFLYIAFFALWGLRGRRFKKGELLCLLAIGIGGIIVDVCMVYTFYLR